VVVLAIIVPFFVRVLPLLYSYSITSGREGSRLTASEDLMVPIRLSSTKADVHIVFISWIIVTFAMILTGIATTKAAVLAGIFFSCHCFYQGI
jgi:hypothetical protein